MKILSSLRTLALASFACAGLFGAPSTFAQGTFTPGTGTATNCNPSSSPLSSYSCTAGSVSVTMTAWGYDSTTSWSAGMLGDFGSNGFGAYTGNKETSNGSHHAFDNVTTGCSGTPSSAISGLSAANGGCGGSVEALLLKFESSPGNLAKVGLTQVGINYVDVDADMSIYRWDGNGAPTLGAVNTAGTGTIAGWTYVGSKDVDNVANSWAGISSGYSSYFLITTYFGAASGSNGAKVDSGDDRFKISAFTVACQTTNCTPSQGPGVPEPASLALASLGLMAAVGVRRRRQRKPG